MIDYKGLTPAVERAARIAKSSFPAHYDISDVKQELWVWIMQNKKTVAGISADSEGTDTALVELLLKAANEYLKREDAAAYGYDREDQYFYSLDLIKSILEVVFKHEDWQSFATVINDMPKAKRDPSKTGNNLASYADVSSAVDTLQEDQYNVIVWRYKYNQTFDQIGQTLGVTRQTIHRRHEAALASLQRALGKRDLGELRKTAETPPRPGRAQAKAIAERDYEG